MGFPIELFIQEHNINTEFICSICQDILQDPIQLDKCEHIFCKSCLSEWVDKNPTCPIDRRTLVPNCVASLSPPQRAFRNLLDDLELKCSFTSFGCTKIFKLGQKMDHERNCSFSSNAKISCSSNCGAVISRRVWADHHCVKYLKGVVQEKEREISNLTQEPEDLKIMVRREESDSAKRSWELLQEVNQLITEETGSDSYNYIKVQHCNVNVETRNMVLDIVTGCLCKFVRSRLTIWLDVDERPSCLVAWKITDELSTILGSSWGCVLSEEDSLLDFSIEDREIMLQFNIEKLNVMLWKKGSSYKKYEELETGALQARPPVYIERDGVLPPWK